MEKRYQDAVVHKSCILEWGFDNLELSKRADWGSTLGVVYTTTKNQIDTSGSRILRQCQGQQGFESLCMGKIDSL